MPVVDEIESLGYDTSFKTDYVRINPKSGNYNEYIVYVRRDGVIERKLESDEHIFKKSVIGKIVLVDGVKYRNAIHTLELVESIDGNDSSKRLSKKEMIHKAVVEFIKWYNKNK